MTTQLHSLTNSSRPARRRKLLGRGVGCKRGKTCGRGHKGMGSRSGYKTRQGYVGGGVPLHKRVPTRGFSNVRFRDTLEVVNLGQIDKLYEDGEIVSIETLKQKGFLKGNCRGLKVLGNGELTKKVSFQVEALSGSAREKITKLKLNCNI
ncbi:MAG: 50S ribosomal protein L15 [Verrucomicrobia bacterium]|nr:50S ribosomal protein L15 [Verrucomicrobiota bacterium]MBS0647164.1 50S ribosomal protein L15 [Verrucomicrobiota bacterium]